MICPRFNTTEQTQGLCTGTYFFDEILGLDAAEQAAYQAAGCGPGQTQLSSFPETLPSGEVKGSYRNILTFEAGGGLGEPYPAGWPGGLTPIAGAHR